MLKKILVAFLVLIIGYVFYSIFLKKDLEAPDLNFEKLIKTKSVQYHLKNKAIIYADEQIGGPEDDEIKFKNVIIDLKEQEMFLSGELATLDTRTENVKLEKSIYGTTKDRVWKLEGEEVEYIKATNVIKSDKKISIENREEKVLFDADSFDTTTEFKVVTFVGNVHSVREQSDIKADKMVYYTEQKDVEAFGNVDIKDDDMSANADRVKYNYVTRNMEAEGNVVARDSKMTANANKVKYTYADEILEAEGNVVVVSPTMRITGQRAIYYQKTEIVKGFGGGTFRFTKDNSVTTGTYVDGTYDMKNETIDTNSNYTINKDEYKFRGKNARYNFISGEATLRSNFQIKRENMTVKGSRGNANTNTNYIHSYNAQLLSDQGDIILSDESEGNFVKREFNLTGNVDGKIRGNVDDFRDPQPLVESEAIHFDSEEAKIYFLVHANKDYSITRGELKQDVDVKYKEMKLNAEYGEIDAAKNLILGRDDVVLKYQENTKMSADYMFVDLNKEKGNAKNNVKIITQDPQVGAVNISADNATIDNVKKIVELTGNVTTYNGKSRIKSEKAVYDLNNKVLKNEQKTVVDYHINSGKQTSESKRKDKKDEFAVEEVKSKVNITSEKLKNKRKINLAKSYKASNGQDVSITWTSSDNSTIDRSGDVNRSYYNGKVKNVVLTATYTSGTSSDTETFNLSVEPESTKEMLERAKQNVSLANSVKHGESINLPNSINVDVYKQTISIPLSWKIDGGETVRDSIQINENRNLTSTLSYNGESVEKKHRVTVN